MSKWTSFEDIFVDVLWMCVTELLNPTFQKRVYLSIYLFLIYLQNTAIYTGLRLSLSLCLSFSLSLSLSMEA
jgi:small basic protein